VERLRNVPHERSRPRQSRKNSEDDSRANDNIRETLGILSDPDARNGKMWASRAAAGRNGRFKLYVCVWTGWCRRRDVGW